MRGGTEKTSFRVEIATGIVRFMHFFAVEEVKRRDRTARDSIEDMAADCTRYETA